MERFPLLKHVYDIEIPKNFKNIHLWLDRMNKFVILSLIFNHKSLHLILISLKGGQLSKKPNFSL